MERNPELREIFSNIELLRLERVVEAAQLAEKYLPLQEALANDAQRYNSYLHHWSNPTDRARANTVGSQAISASETEASMPAVEQPSVVREIVETPEVVEAPKEAIAGEVVDMEEEARQRIENIFGSAPLKAAAKEVFSNYEALPSEPGVGDNYVQAA